MSRCLPTAPFFHAVAASWWLPWAETGTVMSLAAANAWLRSSPVIVSDPDIFFPPDLVHRLGSVRGSLVVATIGSGATCGPGASAIL